MDSGPELSAQEWRAALSQIRSLDIVKVLGGEPFVRADIVEILLAIREEVDPYILQLTTNGMLTERVVEAVQAVAWPGLQLRISVDGRPDTHDRQRGVDGSWRRGWRGAGGVWCGLGGGDGWSDNRYAAGNAPEAHTGGYKRGRVAVGQYKVRCWDLGP